MTTPSPDLSKTLNPARAILLGTLVVGGLDISDALIFYGFRGVAPIRIFHSIAAGLLGGPAARAGGLATALLGALLHFFIAFCIVATFYLASRRMELLTRQPVWTGVAYGIVVYFVMNLVVLPLSAVTPGAFPPPTAILLNGVLIHAFGVGLPSALFARRVPREAAAPTLRLTMGQAP
ncbi:MAG TPA: hypothetical protein VFU23_02835 [Gemmatimonadales bacterium]|nr:hypothetical protein [Gemmatimonadales bacterium]